MTNTVQDILETESHEESRVAIKRLSFDMADLSHSTRVELDLLKSTGASGHWYLNPMFSVSTPEPTIEFLEKARSYQRAWFRILTKHFQNGWRKMRRLAHPESDRPFEFDGILYHAGDVWPYVDLSQSSGNMERFGIVLQRRPEAIKLLKQGKLKEMADIQATEIRQLQSGEFNGEENAHFVLPHLTISSPSGEVFYSQIQREKSAWNHTLKRHLKSSEIRLLSTSVRDGKML
jgi:hypothetical protein